MKKHLENGAQKQLNRRFGGFFKQFPPQHPAMSPATPTAPTATANVDREKAVYLETFGCQMNVADSEVVLARLADAGYQTVDRAEDAGLVLYNTCSVRDNAEAKIRGRLGALQKIKRERQHVGEDLTVGVMGCMAQT